MLEEARAHSSTCGSLAGGGSSGDDIGRDSDDTDSSGGDSSDSSLASHHVAWLAIRLRSGDGQLM